LAIEEFYRLSKKLKYVIDKRALPGTIGDLILTCNSEESRNFSFGKLLAKYKKGKALAMIGETVEGFYTTDSVPFFEKETSLPLARFVYDIMRVDNPKSVKTYFQRFVKTA
jgi:glycerol-3-phosphate dehydrogenase